MTFREEMDVEVVTGLSEKEWERLEAEFLAVIKAASNPLQQRFAFTLTVKQSALFTQQDLPRLIKNLEPPLQDPSRWTVGELGGRKTLYAPKVPHVAPPLGKERLVREFVSTCFDIHADTSGHIAKKEVWIRFFYWSRTKYPDSRISQEEFFETFEDLFGRDFMRKTKRGTTYEGFQIKIRGMPHYPT